MEQKFLEEIGLTKGEIAVYLALIELGSSTVGPIFSKAKVSASKVYDILDRLIDKGLVSFVIRENTKYFEASPPERIMDYLEKREEKLKQQKTDVKKLIPELNLKLAMAKHKSEANIFKGLEGAKTAFEDVLKTLKKGDTYYVMGASTPTEPFFSFINNYHQRRAEAGIRLKILYTTKGEKWANAIKELPYTEIKFSPVEFLSDSFILMYSDKTLIIVATKNDITLFRIENKEVTESLKSQFELSWKQEVMTYNGQEAVENVYEEMIKKAKPNDEVIIFAAKPKTKQGADYNVNWNRRIRQKTKNVRLLYYGFTTENIKRAEEIAAVGCETKIIPTEQTQPISIVVVGNMVVHSVWADKPISFKIENKTLADSLRTNFELLWKQDVSIVKGADAIQQLFEDILDNSGVDWIGARGYFVDHRPEYIEKWEKMAVEKGIKIRNIVDIGVKGHKITKFPFAETKYNLSIEFSRMSCFWIYKNKVAISNWMEKEPIAMIIEDPRICKMYKDQFESLWKQDSISLKGFEGIKFLCEEVINEKQDLYLIGANAEFFRKYPKFAQDWDKRRVQAGIKRHHLSSEVTRNMKFKGLPGVKFNELPDTESRYLPKEFLSPMVIWVFGNKVAHVIWDSESIFLIDNKQVADDYRNYFKMLWGMGKE